MRGDVLCLAGCSSLSETCDQKLPALQDIMAIFQTYGTVKELRVLPGPPGSEGNSSAGALVRMGSSEEAAQAIAGVNAWAASTGTGNGTFPLSVKYADSPEERARCGIVRVLPQSDCVSSCYSVS